MAWRKGISGAVGWSWGVALLACTPADEPSVTPHGTTGTSGSSGAPASTGQDPLPADGTTGTGEPERDDAAEPPVPPPPDLGPGDVPDPPGPQFVDVTEAAGLAVDPGQLLVPPFCLLDSVVGVGTGDYCIPEHFLGAAAVGDFDGDDWPDLYMTRIDAPDRLLRNRGDGTFEDVAAERGVVQPYAGAGAAWLDVEGDGDLDLMLTVIGGPQNYLFINDGTGYFTEQAEAHGAALAEGAVHVGTSIGVGDYDLDGYVDVFVGDWRSNVVLGYAPDHNRLLHNLGAAAPGVFEDVTQDHGIDLAAISTIKGALPGAYGFAPAFVDLDGDHWPELTISADYGTSRLYWNDGAGNLSDGTEAAGVGTETNGMGSTFGDYDGDGDLDWFVTSIDSPFFPEWGNRLFRNEGDRTFTDATDEIGVRHGGWAWGTAFFDPDLDGDLDLALAAGWPSQLYAQDPVRLWIDAGIEPWFEQAEARGLSFDRQGRGLVPLDYDRDGDLDLLVMSYTEIPALWRNDIEGRGWLEVRVQGTDGNHRGVGAEVHVQATAGAPWQVRHIGVGSHFFGHAEAAAYFGLGEGESPVHRVEVLWPRTGQTQVLTDVPRDQRLVVSF